MNTLLDLAGSVLYLAFMTFLLPILVALYAFAGLLRVLVAINQLHRYVPTLVAYLQHKRHTPARRYMMRRRLATAHA